MDGVKIVDNGGLYNSETDPYDPKKFYRFTLTDSQSIIIGRNDRPSKDVAVITVGKGEGVSRVHAIMHAAAGHLYITNKSKNDTWVSFGRSIATFGAKRLFHLKEDDFISLHAPCWISLLEPKNKNGVKISISEIRVE